MDFKVGDFIYFKEKDVESTGVIRKIHGDQYYEVECTISKFFWVNKKTAFIMSRDEFQYHLIAVKHSCRKDCKKAKALMLAKKQGEK